MLQFNLIFVIIVGVMVLAFFLFFTSKYIDLSEKKEAAEISRDLDNIFRGLRSTTQYKSHSLLFDYNLEVDCDDIIINGKYTQKIDSIFFGEDSSSRNLVFWSKEFSKPFRIDNLIFIIDNSSKYYSGSSNFKFPKFVNSGSSGNYDVGVFYEGDCPVNNPISGRKIICVRGDVIEIDGVVFPFIDDVLVYGAAFSDADQFNCSIARVKVKWVNLFDIYIKKNEMLGGCSGIRPQITEELTSLKNKVSVGDFSFSLTRLNNLNAELYNFECGVVY